MSFHSARRCAIAWSFDRERPIYTQIVELIQKGVLAGAYPPGSEMPSVRALALEAGVNPNTMQRALAELEVQGLLHAKRASGRQVTNDDELIGRLRERLAESNCREFVEDMSALGYGREEAARMITAYIRKEAAE
jgi:DNA-binding transcriptional regulator YhcF (GntR family)